MSEIYTMGSWTPSPGSEQAFVEAWTRFASWASSMPGAGRLKLVRDLREPDRFVSFGGWESLDAVREWKGGAEFRERMARVLQHVDAFTPSELSLVASAEAGEPVNETPSTVHYKHEGIATVDATTETLFSYMSAGDHPHAAFKRHRLAGVSGDVVTIEAEVYNPDGSTFATTIEHRLDRPCGIETKMIGGAFDGARFTHTYTPTNGRTRIDLEGEFPVMPGMTGADELAMIDQFFTTVFAEDSVTLRTWSAVE